MKLMIRPSGFLRVVSVSNHISPWHLGQVRILARVQEDRPAWNLVDVGPSVLSRGEELIQKVQMRTLDAIHIASLVTFQTASGIRIPFVTSDSKQRDAAEQMNLHVVWVG